MANDRLNKMGKKGSESFRTTRVENSLDERFDAKHKAKVEARLRSIEARLAEIEQDAEFAECLARVESEVAALRARARVLL